MNCVYKISLRGLNGKWIEIGMQAAPSNIEALRRVREAREIKDRYGCIVRRVMQGHCIYEFDNCAISVEKV